MNNFNFSRLLNIGHSPCDTPELKIKKSTLTLVPLIIGSLAAIWGLLYIYLEHYISAAIPLSYFFISIYNLLQLHKTKDIGQLQKIQMILVLLLPFFLMWSLGGFVAGSFVFIWAFYAPVAALAYEKREQASIWFYTFTLLIVISALIEKDIALGHEACMPEIAVRAFDFLNIMAGLAGIYYLIRFFINEKEQSATHILSMEHKALLESNEKLQQANDKLSFLAHHDSLTKLPNRYYLRDNLKQMLSVADRQKHSVALLFLDLDGFKQVNDLYGHACGDEVLVIIAQRLKSLLRKEDIVARLGGDEFAVVLGYLDSKEYIEEISSRIITEINRDYACINAASPLGVSVGIAMYPDDAKSIDELINLADDAMYQVKNDRKNSYVFFQKGA